jgi:hypothetical protein
MLTDDKLSPPSPPPSASTVLLTSTSTNSKPTWYHTHVFISLSLHTPQLCPPPRHLTRQTLYKRSPCPASSQTTRWLSVIHVTESTWPLASCTVVMSLPRMCTPPLLLSRQNVPSSSSTGAQLDSRLVSASSHLRWFLTEILLRLTVLCKFHHSNMAHHF